MKRVYLSGAEKRKRAKEDIEKISKLPKITGFLRSASENTNNDQNVSFEVQKHVGEVNDDNHNGNSDEKLGKEEFTNQTVEDCTVGVVSSISSSLQNYENTRIQDSSTCSNNDTVISGSQINAVLMKREDFVQENDSSSYSSDSAMWKKIDDNLRSYWLEKGPEYCNNKDADFGNSARIYHEGDKQKIRTLSKSFFEIKLHNDQIVKRDWLLYSPSTGCVFCFVCRLFSPEKDNFAHFGFNDWKHPERLLEHERGKTHKNSLIVYLRRRSEYNRVDTQFVTQYLNEQKYWIQVLRRIADVIKFLASRGLSFRGNDEKFGSIHNGNYLGILELLSEFDPFLKQHIANYGNKGQGSTSYLSANICEEFIELMGKRVLLYIIDEVKTSKYFSISVDSTPDITHTDQLSITIRYVTNQGPVERFLMFVPIERHGAEYLADVVCKFMNDHGLDITDCRGQSYDNASNMAGKYTGLQARIAEINPYARFIPCAGHSLNLIGVSAVECITEVTVFFSFVQRLYTFSVASPYRWNILKSTLGSECEVLKNLSDTRWSAHINAITPLGKGYEKILEALEKISLDDTQKADAKLEARSLRDKMMKFENVFLITVWFDFLTRINVVSKYLQQEKIDLHNAACLLNSLELYLVNARNKFSEYLQKAQVLAKLDSLPVIEQPGGRLRKRSTRITRFEGASEEVHFTYEERLRIKIFFPIIDSLCTNLKKRKEIYDDINSDFKFFTVLQDMSDAQIADSCRHLTVVYDKDVSGDSLTSECIHFKFFLLESKKEKILSISTLHALVKEEFLSSVFPNIEICLRIYLTFMITNCCGERSFSKLKFIKNERRNSTGQNKLNYLSIMSIESDVLKLIDVEDVIADFSLKKSRRKL